MVVHQAKPGYLIFLQRALDPGLCSNFLQVPKPQEPVKKSAPKKGSFTFDQVRQPIAWAAALYLSFAFCVCAQSFCSHT
jgi:hypothetical protein